jgi:hypothetical protein
MNNMTDLDQADERFAIAWQSGARQARVWKIPFQPCRAVGKFLACDA